MAEKTKDEELQGAIEANRNRSIAEQLFLIQQELNAPKNLKNKEKDFNYRNIEDLLETTIRPLCRKWGCAVILSDRVVSFGNAVYVESTATLRNCRNEEVHATGWAREHFSEPGKFPAQITGSCSSYARKYAVGGLFAIGSGEKELDSTLADKESSAPLTVTLPATQTPAPATAAASATPVNNNVTVNNNKTDNSVKVTISPEPQEGGQKTVTADVPAQPVKRKAPLTPDLLKWTKVQVGCAKSDCDAEEATRRLVDNYIMSRNDLKTMLMQSGKLATDAEFDALMKKMFNS